MEYSTTTATAEKHMKAHQAYTYTYMHLFMYIHMYSELLSNLDLICNYAAIRRQQWVVISNQQRIYNHVEKGSTPHIHVHMHRKFEGKYRKYIEKYRKLD